MKNIGKYEPVVERQTRFLSIRGVKYCINEWGDKDAPLLFYLHGWADTGSNFQFVADALGPHWRIIAPDWRGFGRSTCNAKAYWFPDYLADLHELLGMYSDGVPVTIIGHSMGANVACLYAGILPERVRSIINIEGFGLPDSDPTDAPLRYRKWLKASETTPVFQSYPDFASLAVKIRKRSPNLSEEQADFVAREWASDIDGTVRLQANPMHKLPTANLYRRAEAAACWRNISARMLLVCGRKSPFADQLSSFEAALSSPSKSCTLPEVGHMIHFEAPEGLAREIEAFLK
jgi:pimeloyl-ACP methyl ester carboxylesterase